MKKTAALAAALLLAVSAPVSGYAATAKTTAQTSASATVATHKRIYSEADHSAKAMSYSTARVVLSKKSGKNEYIKTDINYPNMRGYTSNITQFNDANKLYMRNLGENFIKEYTKEAKKYNDANGKFTSSKAEAPYSLKVEYSMKFNKNSVISVFYTKTTTIAGEKTVEYSSRNFDFVTGKEIVPDDVSLLTTKGETAKLALKNIESKVKTGKKIYYQDIKLTASDLNFYFEDKAIVFFVQPGLIADESRGIVTYRLDDEAARAYLKNKVK